MIAVWCELSPSSEEGLAPARQCNHVSVRVCDSPPLQHPLYRCSIGMPRTNTGLGADVSRDNLEEHCDAVAKGVVAASKSQKTAQVYVSVLSVRKTCVCW